MRKILTFCMLFLTVFYCGAMDTQIKRETNKKKVNNIVKFLENSTSFEESTINAELLAQFSGTVGVGKTNKDILKYPFRTHGGFLFFVPENVAKKSSIIGEMLKDCKEDVKKEWRALDHYPSTNDMAPLIKCDPCVLRIIFLYAFGDSIQIAPEKLRKYLVIADYLGLKGEKVLSLARDYLEKVPLRKQNAQLQNIAIDFLPCCFDISDFISSEQGTILNLEDKNLYTLRGLGNISKMLSKNGYSANSVEKISFKNNNIIKFEPELFTLFPNLQQLDLSHNKITRICEGDFCNVPVGCIIFLNNNEIKTIKPGAFNNFKGHISLESNKIERLVKGAFGGIRNGSRIDLRNNQINSIEPGAFKKFMGGTIWLDGNQLRDQDSAVVNKEFSLAYYQRFANWCNKFFGNTGVRISGSIIIGVCIYYFVVLPLYDKGSDALYRSQRRVLEEENKLYIYSKEEQRMRDTEMMKSGKSYKEREKALLYPEYRALKEKFKDFNDVMHYCVLPFTVSYPVASFFVEIGSADVPYAKTIVFTEKPN